MLLLILLSFAGIGVVGLVELVPLYRSKKWKELVAAALLLFTGVGLAIAQIMGLELDIPLLNMIELMPPVFEPVRKFLLSF